MAYPSDPAGNFASDAHRRVITWVPHADQDIARDTDSIVARVRQDDGMQVALDDEQVLSILEDLEADGDIEKSDDGWVMTEQGADVGNGPTAQDGGRQYYE